MTSQTPSTFSSRMPHGTSPATLSPSMPMGRVDPLSTVNVRAGGLWHGRLSSDTEPPLRGAPCPQVAIVSCPREPGHMANSCSHHVLPSRANSRTVTA